MAHENLDLTAPPLPQAQSPAIRGEDEPESEREHALPTGEAETEGLPPALQHLTEPCISQSGEATPTQNATSQKAEQSNVDAPPALSMSAEQLVYNNLVALDGIFGMEVDSQPSDNDSTLGDSIYGSSTTSLRASVYEFIQENGRTYHSYNSGKYLLPNDEAEQDRLDLQHQLFLLSLGDLHLAPISKTPHNVLDIGTGTGIWAIEFAQKYPSADVIGTDLSPIQPEYVPPNCRFEVGDFEDEWLFSHKFDYVHGRALTATMRDPVKIITSAFNALEPGGWLELQDPTMPFLCIDDTMEGTALQEWMRLICTAGEKLGRSWLNSRNYKCWMEDIGFVNTSEEHFPWAVSPWPKGKKQKLVALWMQQDFLDGLQGFSLALLTKAFGWTPEQIELFLVDVRKDIKNRHIHAYLDTLVVYGQKPG